MEDEGTYFEHILSATGKALYNHSLLIWCLVLSLLDTEMHYYN